MAITYKRIASVTVGSGGAANIEFTSIPQTYTDLVMFVSSRDAGTVGNWSEFYIQPNGATTNRNHRNVYGTGTVTGSDTFPDLRGWLSNANNTASTFGNVFIYISNYAGSTAKSFSIDAVTENNATGAIAVINAGLWDNTAAITSITLSPGVGNFQQHSTATLYGIKRF